MFSNLLWLNGSSHLAPAMLIRSCIHIPYIGSNQKNMSREMEYVRYFDFPIFLRSLENALENINNMSSA